MEPFIGMIVQFGGNFAPRGWALCNGQILSIAQHTALFSILGTTYGGDGRTSFALPDLRGRVAIHEGAGPGLTLRKLGETGGHETVTLTVNQMPAHNHPVLADKTLATTGDPVGNAFGHTGDTSIYEAGPPNQVMDADTIGNRGGGQPVDVMPPFLAINFIIALEGIFPSRN
ncbi:Microcystin dependent protein [Enhygromyxa salina]|uniref:Microcystin dependent protein n=1 Tax=Enhygromyxa salina TaxID=215803 RepID=A0A0C2DD18_9BACT|nr:tail fiber protein [Enhygromyxa salina]KIG17597.1 Microcystin dependent protein [Enhygromyxa salina]